MKEASEMNFQKLRTIIKAVKLNYFVNSFNEFYMCFLEWSYTWNNSCTFIKYDSSFN
jgi:hypothetical protein